MNPIYQCSYITPIIIIVISLCNNIFLGLILRWNLWLSAATCDTRQTGWFDIRDKHNGCFNRRSERGVVCAGTCEPGSCCSAVFDKEDQSTAIYFMMDCPDPKVKSYSLRFFLPVDCECVDCNSTVRAPNFFGPRWRIIFRPWFREQFV